MTLHLSLQSRLRAKVNEFKSNVVLSPWAMIPLMLDAAARLDELEKENAELRLQVPHHEVQEKS